jgi:signal transduction histidine kinase
MKRLVARHHGQVTVQSTVDQGTTFIVSIPVRSEAEQRGEQQEGERRGSRGADDGAVGAMR